MKKHLGKRTVLALCLAFTASVLGGCGDDQVKLSELKTDKYVTLGEYKGLEVTVPKTEVTEEYQENYMNYILSEHTEQKEVNRPVQQGDTVTIDYEGKLDGVPFEGGTDTGFDLAIGSHTFIEGFEDGLVGVNAGETVDLNLTFPEDYTPELAGKDVVFTVTVHKITEPQTPELTDEFVKSLDVGCDTVAEYRVYVKELLEKDAEQTWQQNVEQALIDELTAKCTFKEPPKGIVDEYYNKIYQRMNTYAAMSQMTLEVFLNTYGGMSLETFEEQAREDAAEAAKESIMLQAIANAEGITVTEEDKQAAIAKDIEQGGYTSEEELKMDMGEDYTDYAMADKVMEFLRENAVIHEE